ncbi:MAG: SPOR domain-containing protein [Proteobacteria bacterium]|jgi:cell division protein FtsN|nr:SPOR domain-containing protein [Pseudomonadota bacterium]MDA1298791.1 SPOR domain-containing protein [Pseudomonadota bacterium]
MAQDFAKRARPRKGTGDRSGSRPFVPAGPGPRLTLFGSGFIAGVFVSALVYLSFGMPVDSESTVPVKPTPSSAASPEIEEMQWDFYEIFPRSEVPIIEQPGGNGSGPRAPEKTFAYILQAGSFRSAKDADQLRAELILMGLDAFTRKVKVNGEDWHRVIVGPLDAKLDLNRAQDKLAQAQIAAIPYRVNR